MLLYPGGILVLGGRARAGGLGFAIGICDFGIALITTEEAGLGIGTNEASHGYTVGVAVDDGDGW